MANDIIKLWAWRRLPYKILNVKKSWWFRQSVNIKHNDWLKYWYLLKSQYGMTDYERIFV